MNNNSSSSNPTTVANGEGGGYNYGSSEDEDDDYYAGDDEFCSRDGSSTTVHQNTRPSSTTTADGPGVSTGSSSNTTTQTNSTNNNSSGISNNHTNRNNLTANRGGASMRSVMTEDLAAQQMPTGLNRYTNATRVPSLRRPAAESTRRIHERKGGTNGTGGDDDDEDLSDSERPGAYAVHDRANGMLPAWHRMFAPSSGVSTASQDTETAMDNHDRWRPSQPQQRQQTNSDHNDDDLLDANSEHRHGQDLESMGIIEGHRIPRKDSSTLLSRRRMIVLATLGVILVVAVAIGVSVALQSKNDPGDDGGTSSEVSSSSSTDSTESMTTSRKSQLIDLLVMNDITPRLTFDDTSSPQFEAVSWLADTDPLALDLSNTDQDVLLDRYALACFFFATNGLEDWANPLNFLTEKSVCEWNAVVESNNTSFDDATLPFSVSTQSSVAAQTQGVFCDDNQEVAEIRIDGNNLRGFIPEELSVLSYLKKFHVTRNTYMAGDTELSLLANVAQVGKLTTLKELDLSNNKLYGRIPDSFFDLVELQELNLAGNSFTDTVDRRIGNLVALRSLNLAGNDIDGTIRFETLTNLEILVLDDGLGKGAIVDVQIQLLPLTNLKELRMKGVYIFQPFLSDLSGMTNLEVLDLGDMALDGSIGTSFSSLTSLRYLSVKRNLLTGPIVPEGFGTLSNLEFLDLSNNLFIGSLPSFPASLLELHIFDNQFSGSVDNVCPTSASLQIELDCGNGLESNCSCCVCHSLE